MTNLPTTGASPTPAGSGGASIRRPAIPELLGTDQPERRILREPHGTVDILIACYPAIDPLAQQVRQRELRVLPLP
jgi:hypothetical protein